MGFSFEEVSIKSESKFDFSPCLPSEPVVIGLSSASDVPDRSVVLVPNKALCSVFIE